MDISTAKEILLYSLVINYAMITIWFLAFYFAHEWMYRLHSKWFSIKTETFDAIHYCGMAIYKIFVLILNVAPLIAICLAT